MEEVVNVPISKLRDLVKARTILGMLENGGVDNWDGFSESLNPDDEESYYDISDSIDTMSAEELLKAA